MTETTPGECAKQIRELTGLNQRQFAKEMGIANSVLSMLEGGKQPMSARYASKIENTARHYLLYLKGESLQNFEDMAAGIHLAGARARGWRV